MDNKKTGYWYWYYENGIIELEGAYEKDKREGKYIKKYENGNIELITNYKNGKEDGEIISYHKNGEIESKYKKYNDFMIGRYVLYY